MVLALPILAAEAVAVVAVQVAWAVVDMVVLVDLVLLLLDIQSNQSEVWKYSTQLRNGFAQVA